MLLRRLVLFAFALTASRGSAQQPEPKNWTAQDDHRNMMEQLGIKALRPGPSGNEADANHPNYHESTAYPVPNLPHALTLKSGTKVKTREQWVRRRAEIVEDFSREVFGRVPKNAPKVEWKVVATDTGTLNGVRVNARQLVGH